MTAASKLWLRPTALSNITPPIEIPYMKRRGYVFRDIEFSHPFQDKSPEIHRRRLNEVARFFMQESVN